MHQRAAVTWRLSIYIYPFLRAAVPPGCTAQGGASEVDAVPVQRDVAQGRQHGQAARAAVQGARLEGDVGPDKMVAPPPARHGRACAGARAAKAGLSEAAELLDGWGDRVLAITAHEFHMAQEGPKPMPTSSSLLIPVAKTICHRDHGGNAMLMPCWIVIF